MVKDSQKKIVLAELRENGEVSRNWCLQRFITRLAAIIYSLKKEGYVFSERRVGGDYFYKIEASIA